MTFLVHHFLPLIQLSREPCRQSLGHSFHQAQLQNMALSAASLLLLLLTPLISS